MKQSFFEKMKGAHSPETQSFVLRFNAETCTHCRMCVQTCPTCCLQWDEEKKLPYGIGLGAMALACIGCNSCEAICPSDSIRVRGEYRVLEGRYKTAPDMRGDMTPLAPLNGKTPGNTLERAPELTETEKVIYNRRSIRLFKKKTVPKEMINRILEAARFAPSAGNGQPWKFIVVTDRNVSERIDRECARFLDKIVRLYDGKQTWRKILISALSLLQVNKWDQRPISAMEKMRHEKDITFSAPVVIHILKDHRGISHPDLDVALAAQNLVLAAHALGLGTCYIGFIAGAMSYMPDAKKLLGVDAPFELVTSVCVGFPKVTGQNRPVPRRPLAVEWIEP